MQLSFEGRQVRAVIRALMKKGGYRYADLAAALKVSEPTVKRCLTRGDFPLERLVSIAAWLGVPLAELIGLAGADGQFTTELTEAQERLFVQHPRWLLCFHLLFSGWKAEQISGQHGFTARELRAALGGLEKAGFVEVWPGGRVRLKVRGFFRMRPGGALEQAAFGRVARAIWGHALAKQRGYADAGAKEGSAFLFRPFELTLREETYLELARELRELVGKYRAVSARQISLERRDRLRSYSGLLVADELFVWPQVVGEMDRATGRNR